MIKDIVDHGLSVCVRVMLYMVVFALFFFIRLLRSGCCAKLGAGALLRDERERPGLRLTLFFVVYLGAGTVPNFHFLFPPQLNHGYFGARESSIEDKSRDAMPRP